MSFSGQTALVTGGSSGIGFECCRHLLLNGVQKLCIVGRNEKNGQTAVKKITSEFGQDRAMYIKADVSKLNDMEVAFKTVIDAWKTLNIVINNAGMLNDQNWSLEIDVNLKGVIHGSQLAFKYMSKSNGGHGGTLVNMASILGLQAMASVPVYVATKHAILGYSRSMGMPFNYDKSGIRVITMCPGVTITPLVNGAHHLASSPENASEVRRELDSLPSQTSDNCGIGLIHIIKYGQSGSVWVSEGGEPIYEVAIPDRLTLKKN